MAQAAIAVREREGGGKTEENAQILRHAQQKVQAAADAKEEVAIAQREAAAAKKMLKMTLIAAMNAVDTGASQTDIQLETEVAELEVASADAALEAAEAVAAQAESEAAVAELAAGSVRVETGVDRTQFMFAVAGEACPVGYNWIVDMQTCKQAAEHFSLAFQRPDVDSSGQDGNENFALEAAESNETDLCRTHGTRPGEATLSNSNEAGGLESKPICQVDPRKFTITRATYGENCADEAIAERKYNPEEGYEEGVLYFFKQKCYNVSTQEWNEHCAFKFQHSKYRYM
jgi:hypothetical protein